MTGSYSYGGGDGLYEIAVLHDGVIVYNTPITSDVLGYLTEEDVMSTLKDISLLPTRSLGV